LEFQIVIKKTIHYLNCRNKSKKKKWQYEWIISALFFCVWFLVLGSLACFISEIIYGALNPFGYLVELSGREFGTGHKTAEIYPWLLEFKACDIYRV
jgi:hypothetical protein